MVGSYPHVFRKWNPLGMYNNHIGRKGRPVLGEPLPVKKDTSFCSQKGYLMTYEGWSHSNYIPFKIGSTSIIETYLLTSSLHRLECQTFCHTFQYFFSHGTSSRGQHLWKTQFVLQSWPNYCTFKDMFWNILLVKRTRGLCHIVVLPFYIKKYLT